MLILGCFGAFLAGVIAGRGMPSLLTAIAAGAGGILLVIFVIFPDYDWSLVMVIALPACGALGALTRLFKDRGGR